MTFEASVFADFEAMFEIHSGWESGKPGGFDLWETEVIDLMLLSLRIVTLIN